MFCILNCRMVSMDWQTTINWCGPIKLPRYILYIYFLLVSLSAFVCIFKVPSFVMYFLDSGGGSYPELVYDDQIQWLKDMAASLHTKFQSLPAIAFFHIPTWGLLITDSCPYLSNSPLLTHLSLSLSPSPLNLSYTVQDTRECTRKISALVHKMIQLLLR